MHNTWKTRQVGENGEKGVHFNNEIIDIRRRRSEYNFWRSKSHKSNSWKRKEGIEFTGD